MKKIKKMKQNMIMIMKMKRKVIQRKKKELNNSVNKSNIILTPLKRKKTHRIPSIVLLQTIKKRNMLRNEMSPISALKRLLSEKDNLVNLKLNKKSKKYKAKELDQEKTISKFDEETFKTSLYDTKKF